MLSRDNNGAVLRQKAQRCNIFLALSKEQRARREAGVIHHLGQVCSRKVSCINVCYVASEFSKAHVPLYPNKSNAHSFMITPEELESETESKPNIIFLQSTIERRFASSP